MTALHLVSQPSHWPLFSVSRNDSSAASSSRAAAPSVSPDSRSLSENRTSALSAIAHRYRLDDSGATAPSVPPPPFGGTAISPVAPPDAISASGRFPSDGLLEITSYLKTYSVDAKTAAAKRFGQFYEDLMRIKSKVLAAASGGGKKTYFRRDKALAAYALLYLKWSSTPLGEVTTMFDEKEWRTRGGTWKEIDKQTHKEVEKSNIVFRTIDGKTLAFIDCDKAFSGIWHALSRENTEKGEIFPGIERVPQLMYYVDQQTAPSPVPTSINTEDVRFQNLPDSVTNFKKGDWSVTQERYDALFAKLEDAAENGISWGLRDHDRTLGLAANQWGAIDSTIDNQTSPWGDRASAMATSARNAVTFYDQMFEVLAKVLRSYNDADQKFFSTR